MESWVFVCCVIFLVGGGVRPVQALGVVYDGRSLIIDGSRAILFSGSIHYPRSTPQMWPSLIAKAKQGGLDVIQTYVFWNKHEPREGQYNFGGRYDLVRFLTEVKSQGLYASLRIGPFIESEWSYGGLPFWLHDVPGIVFRSDNEPFKFYMQNFTTKIVNLMKENSLYASQGGPIILSQIENEYQNVEAAFHEKGPPYVKWAAEMAVGQKTGVPWVMCKQDDAPDPVINTCNGMNCGETFKGPNSPNKPSIWTENWTSFYQVFGGEPYLRSAEDIAYAVALFIGKNGSFVNYYMYHGGTNFGRAASAYVTTAYYDQAPLDEYGIIRQPKWGHLKDLHAAVKQCSEPLLFGKPSNYTLGDLQHAFVFEKESGECAAFLENSDRKNGANVMFRDSSYDLPPRSISILPDCKNVIFNTARVNVQSSVRSSTTSEKFDDAGRWQEIQDVIPNYGKTPIKADRLLEQMSTTKDSSDYLWYTFSCDYKSSDDDKPLLQVNTRAHVIYAFINNVSSGSAHGNHDLQGFNFDNPISLKDGKNDIAILSVMAGLPDSGAYMESRVSGLQSVQIQASGNSQDLSNQSWGYQVGLLGEELKIYTYSGGRKVQWRSGVSSNQPLMWYKTHFSTPHGNDPIALNLTSMGKGEVWINGQSIGRYWVSFHTSKGKPSQTLYHIPRYFLKPVKNLLVLLEESGGEPLQITLETISVSSVCGHVSDSHPNGSPQQRKMPPVVQLECPPGKTISEIEFASFGTPAGSCNGQYSIGSCHSEKSREAVEKACRRKRKCSVALTSGNFGGDPCPGTSKSLLVDARCS